MENVFKDIGGKYADKPYPKKNKKSKFKAFLSSQYDKAKEKVKDRLEFEKELSRAKKDSYRKEKLRLASFEGKKQARSVPFSNLSINTKYGKPRKRKNEYRYI